MHFKKILLFMIVIGALLTIAFWPMFSDSDRTQWRLNDIIKEDFDYDFLIGTCKNSSHPIYKDKLPSINSSNIFDNDGYVLDTWGNKILVDCFDEKKNVFIVYSIGKNKKDENANGDDVKVFIKYVWLGVDAH